jgi:hypothetical protein
MVGGKEYVKGLGMAAPLEHSKELELAMQSEKSMAENLEIPKAEE